MSFKTKAGSAMQDHSSQNVKNLEVKSVSEYHSSQLKELLAEIEIVESKIKNIKSLWNFKLDALSEPLKKFELKLKQIIEENIIKDREEYILNKVKEYQHYLLNVKNTKDVLKRRELFNTFMINFLIIKNEIAIAYNELNPRPVKIHPELSGYPFLIDDQDFVIFDELLNLYLKDEKNVFRWSKNFNRACLIHHAAKGNYAPLLELFIKSAIKQKADFPDYKIWLYPDFHQRKTPLHIGAERGNLEACQMLWQYISLEENAIELLNQKDEVGNTALHLTCKKWVKQSLSEDNAVSGKNSKLLKLIIFLVRNGADLRNGEKDNISPLDYIVSNKEADKEIDKITYEKIGRLGLFIGQTLPTHVKSSIVDHIENDCVIPLLGATDFKGSPLSLLANCKPYASPYAFSKVFNLFDKETQKEIVTSCEYVLKRHPDNEEVKTFYFTYLASQKSLLELTLAHLNFNSKIKPRTFALTPQFKEVTLIPELLSAVPFYVKKLQAASPDNINALQLKADKEKAAEEQAAQETRLYYADYDQLCRVLDSIDAYIGELKSKPRESQVSKIIAGVLMALVFLAYAALMTSLVYQANVYDRCYQDPSCRYSPKAEEYSRLASKYIIFAMIGFFAAPIPLAICGGIGGSLCNREFSISRNEWSKFVDVLNDFLNKANAIQRHDRREKTTHPYTASSRLPVSEANVDALDTHLGLFRNDRLMRSTVKQGVKDLKSTVREMLSDMKKIKKPFSLTFHPARPVVPKDSVILDIPESDDSEKKALLRKKR